MQDILDRQAYAAADFGAHTLLGRISKLKWTDHVLTVYIFPEIIGLLL